MPPPQPTHQRSPQPLQLVQQRDRDGARSGPPATQEDLAEMARLKDLPAYAAGLGDGDYSVGPQ